MPYTALPDHRMPWDNDGTLVYIGDSTIGAATVLSGPDALEFQDTDLVPAGATFSGDAGRAFFFFPEQREVTGYYARCNTSTATVPTITGSNDTTNGMDGTWETASLPAGAPGWVNDFSWRADIKPISFTGPKKNVRLHASASGSGNRFTILHLYGEAAAGQMAHDLIFLDPDLGAGVAFPAPEDFGDQPLGTTVVRPFRVKNTSASRTAANVNIQCNDADFAIATAAGGPWVVTINIASLGPGVESATMYIRCTTPAPGAALLPRFARIIATCDAGFFG